MNPTSTEAAPIEDSRASIPSMNAKMPYRRRRYLSPPPPFLTNRAHSPTLSLGKLGRSVWSALDAMCQDISPFHRVLISQLLMLLVAVELLRSGRADPLLSFVLGLMKIGLVADCISILTLRMRRLSGSSGVLAFLLRNVPIVTGPSAELALAIHVLRRNKPSTANSFLIGSVYAKPLAMGASCLILQGLHARIPGIDMPPESPIVPWLLGVSGVLILASAPHIDSDKQWISQGVPLFLVLHAGFSYYFGTWGAARHKRRVEGGRVSVQKYNSIAAPREWVALLICLGTLKAGAVLLVGGLLDQAHALVLHSEPSIPFLADGTFVDFTVLPLATAALDHLTDLRIAYEGDDSSSWANLIQSTLQTYFFVRPLAALAGHDIDPRDGRVSIGLCFMAIASWLWLPVVPRSIKGLVLLLTYSYLSFVNRVFGVASVATNVRRGTVTEDHLPSLIG
ncbi:hypothetical protein PMIN01_12067 [Paraphaeosphaeria minitans]|uniref:Sodium/calcium exchanger membrane region domain-containing protein n=1 Tax=Paraphaeosphaeria minitans TaxID=565426 RepID=A0A9P6KL56_9PLEO|nr:hypothetical protein PMIN01_12067 [Paraphaeosphaeria minitans]